MRHEQEGLTLTAIARQAMLDRGFIPEFSAAVLQQAEAVPGPAEVTQETRDLRDLLWISIDNESTKDMDQLTFARPGSAGKNVILVAIADVDALVFPGTPIDHYAAHNTTSIYTPTIVFPMLPTRLSTDMTSLREDADRCALIVEVEVDSTGDFRLVEVYEGYVRNQAKLTYDSVSAYLEHGTALPVHLANVTGLPEQVQLQNHIAECIKLYRDREGALLLVSPELRPVIVDDRPVSLEEKVHRAGDALIENFMIAANVAVMRYFVDNRLPAISRVVRTPKRWDRIIELAKEKGYRLTPEPDIKALQGFLATMHETEPQSFADLSLAVIKLIGRGEYVAEIPGKVPIGHFDLALPHYAHTTAPNRRYPDLIMQRILKAHLGGHPPLYSLAELQELAGHCTEKEDDAAKVERRIQKSAAAMVLENQLGHEFAAIVTGAGANGTWVRVFNPPVEGKLVSGSEGIDVGDHIRVRLVEVDVQRGYIDFIRL